MEMMNQKVKKGFGRARGWGWGWGWKLSRHSFSGPLWIGRQDSDHVTDTEEEYRIQNNSLSRR